MSKPLWPAVSGAIARDAQVEVIANNLANANTNGFKRDDVTFKEYLSKKENMNDTGVDVPRSPIKDKDLYHLEGRDQSFVIVNGTHTKFNQGAMRVTDNPLDLALNGPGFFEVATPAGLRYTRAGSFKISGDGNLVTSEGNPVLSTGGNSADDKDLAGRYINLNGREGTVHINDHGELYMNDEKVAQLSVVEFENSDPLRKVGSSNFENKDPKRSPASASQTWVKQGMVEASNVNPVQEISNLIRANRMFEQDLKAMKTVSEMLQREANDISKI